jgi:hypothetical protein
VFGKHARRVVDALSSHYTVTSAINPTKPVPKGFEITVAAGAGEKETVVWSGKDKGPPRALKFPSDEEILAKVQAALK